MPPFAQNLMKLPTRSKLVLGGGALAVLLVLFLMLRIASAPSYSTLVSGLDPAETGNVTAALDEQGIAYQRRLEGSIARNIEQVDGVTGAQVQLVLPEESLFADEASPSTAAVLLT